MKKLLLTLKTALSLFGLSLALTTTSVQAEDIEIYGTADASNPPVNVMFVFDLSGSMLRTPDGDPTHDLSTDPWTGPANRRQILLQALTDVLDRNKTMANLRVGFTWFDTNKNGISYPATSISADLHDQDPLVPAGLYNVHDFIPHQLEQVRVKAGVNTSKTNIVGSLYEVAKYYRGDTVSGRPGHKPGKLYGDRAYGTPHNRITDKDCVPAHA